MVFRKNYDNGLRLVVKQMDGLLSVSIGILVGTGAAFETDEEDGISHFIEHTQFKGTKKRDVFEINDAFDRIGAEVNAFTGKDTTCYYTKCTSDHTAEAFEILSDLFLNATFPEDEIQKERGVILEEINMNEDTPDDLCLDLLARAIYGKENYGRNILGSPENVKKFTVDDILRYKKARYCPQNIVISFAGGIDVATAEALVETYFGALPKGEYEYRDKKIVRENSQIIKNKPIEQVHFALGYPTLCRNHPLADALQTLNGVLGSSMSSRLFREVREKMGLAYSVYSYVSAYKECGSLIVYAGVNPDNTLKAYDAVRKIIDDVYRNGITDDEFSRDRERMKAGLLFSQESTSSQMLLYGKYLLANDELFDFEGKLDRINKITKADVDEVISLTFGTGGSAVAAVGKLGKDFTFGH